MVVMSPMTRLHPIETFYNMKKTQQKDILMIKSLQPSVAVMKWHWQKIWMTPHYPRAAYAALQSQRHNFSSVDDHQQPHNHQNLICHVHKSHPVLDS